MRFNLTQDYPAGLDRLWSAFGQADYPQRKYLALGAIAVRVRRFLVTMEAIEVELERDVPVGLPVRAHASGTIVESASGYTRMELTWQVDSVLGERVERQFADQIKAALDDDHTFTLQYLDQVVVR